MLTFISKPCMFCGHQSELQIDEAAHRKWKKGALIQEAFPDMPKEQRELLISGTHDTCWNDNFKDED